MGINLDTLRPEPCVEGHTTPGGYSSKAVKPIALAKACLPPGHALCSENINFASISFCCNICVEHPWHTRLDHGVPYSFVAARMEGGVVPRRVLHACIWAMEHAEAW